MAEIVFRNQFRAPNRLSSIRILRAISHILLRLSASLTSYSAPFPRFLFLALSAFRSSAFFHHPILIGNAASDAINIRIVTLVPCIVVVQFYSTKEATAVRPSVVRRLSASKGALHQRREQRSNELPEMYETRHGLLFSTAIAAQSRSGFQ